MPSPLVQAVSLSKIVQSGDAPLTILDGVAFDIDERETVAISGASGSGKTTLLGLLAGLDDPTSGDVVLDGVSLSTLDQDGRAALRQRLVGFVFQSFQLLPALTAQENVMLPLELAGAPDATPRAREWLTRVGLARRTTHYPRQLSGGEQQRVAIARALIKDPIVIFADEPTGNLDRAGGDRIIQLLRDRQRAEHCTLVIVTHDRRFIRPDDLVLEIEDGRVKGEVSQTPRGVGVM